MEMNCVFCDSNMSDSFGQKCKCDQCNLVFHTQCAKMRNIDKCIRCSIQLPIPGSSPRPIPAPSHPSGLEQPSMQVPVLNKPPSSKSTQNFQSSQRSRVSLDIEHLRREEELFMQQQQERQWLLEDKHKRQESFLKRKIELERQLNASSDQSDDDDDFYDANDFDKVIKKVEEWQTPT